MLPFRCIAAVLAVLVLLIPMLPAVPAPLGAVSVAAATPFPFENRVRFGPGSDLTLSVAVGDLNGDGALDIVAGNDGQQNVVYLNDGLGSFAAANTRLFGTGADRTQSVALGDLNGDGALDIVAGNRAVYNFATGVFEGGQNVVYLNDGLGSFAAVNTRLFGPGSDLTLSVALGDLNGDGALDIVAGNYQQQNVVYLNDGLGSFAAANTRLFGTGADNTESVAVGDLNGDGALDIVVGNYQQQNVVYLNDGLGSFTAANTHLFGTGADNTRSVALGDLNGDGALDIVVGNYQQQNVVYLNDGLGSFTAANTRLFGPGADRTQSVALGDLNGDGALDIVAGNSFQPNVVYLNDGLGSFAAANTRLFGTGAEDTVSVALGDLNGDGALDIVAGNYQQQNVVYLNDGLGSFAAANTRLFGPGADNTQSVAVGDLNGDGALDIVVGNYQQQNVVYLNDGLGSFAAANTRLFGPGSDNTQSVALGDLNGDGALDIVAGNLGQDVVYLNDGLGSFAAANTRLFGPGSDRTVSVALGDLNGDGALDIVAGNDGQQNVVYLNDGLGSFTVANTRLFGPGADRTQSVALGDLNGDGALDIVVGNYQQQSVVYLNDGLGSFAAVNTRLFGPGVDNTQSVALGDLNGDSALDIVAGNSFQQNVVYLNDGLGSFAAANTRLFGPGADNTRSVALGDLNGDGALDIVAGNSFQQNVVYLNDGLGSFTAANTRLFGPGADNTWSVAVGDLNGDGALDIVTGNYGEQNVVYRNGLSDTARQPNNQPSIAVTRPGKTRNANFYSTPELQASNTITIPYTLTDPEGDLVREVRAEYSLNGGGHWRPAIAETRTITRSLVTTGQALVLSGASQAIQSNAAVLKVNTALTAEAWIFPTSNTGNQVILNREGEYELGRFSDGTIRWALANTNPGWTWRSTGFVAPLNRWTHIALTYSTVLFGVVRVYANGNLVDSYTGSGVIGDADTANNQFRIGGRQAPFDTSFVGRIDDVRIWNITRTQDQIQDSMHRLVTGSVTGLRGAWRFDDARSSANAPYVWTMPDSSGNAANGTLLGYSAAALPLANGAPTGAQHLFIWDTFASELFGQSDNVVIRLVAYPALSSGPNGTPIFQRPYASATTFPFRVRGTQVQVVDPQNVGQPNAVVFRLNDQLSPDQQLFAASTSAPAYTTNTSGYLAGRGTLSFNDQLVALAPVPLPGPYAETYSQTVHLYATNIITTPNGISGFPVRTSGVQKVTVSLDHPFMLFDLKISLEWDARYDARYMAQLEGDLARASELLFQASHGQAALGSVTIFHDKEYWDYADIRIYASNRVRPSALIGGVARLEITDPTAPAPVIYGPGQVHMGATWNRFGSSTGSLSEDWPRTLVHELGHYLFFLEDNYLGLDPDSPDTLRSVTTCPGLMSDTYAGIWQFQTRASWSPGCDATFSNQTTERADWETIQTFYPAIKPPTQPVGALPSGPIRFPLATTEITSVTPLTPTARLDVPIFYTVDATGARLIPGLPARGYLFQHGHADPDDNYTEIISLGRANTDQLLARGARAGDRVCLFEPTAARFGCETISNGDELLTLRSQPWHPDIQVTPVTSTTLNVQVLGLPLNTPVLDAQLYPLDDDLRPMPITLNMISNGIYSGTFKLAYPLAGAYIHLSSTGEQPVWEAVTSFALGGNGGGFSRIGGGGGFSRIGGGGGFSRIGGGGGFSRIGGGGGFSRIGGGGGFMRTGSAPVSSAEGDVLLTGKHLDFALGQFLVLQTANSLPDVPSWATLIGQGYRFTTSPAPNTPDLTGTALSFSYLDSEVPPGQENGIQVYYRRPSATQWTAISTTIDTAFNLASIPTQGPGLYALMTSVHVPLLSAGWNNFSYPVSANREVGQALASINGKYQIVYSHVPTDTLDPWKVYAPAPAPAWVNDLKELTFGHGYWIYMTEATDLLLNGGASFRTATTGTLSLPPAIIYGVVPTSVSEGQTVEAWVGTTLCGSGTTQGESGQVVFKVKVAAIGLTTPNCGNTGSIVTITVVGNSIGSIAWDNTRASNLTPGFNHMFLPLIQR